MRRHLKLTSISLVLSAVVLAALAVRTGSALAGEPEFSAVLETETAGEVTKARVNFAGDKQRMEIADPQSRVSAVMIIRLDKGVVWTLMPSEKLYMETAVDRKDVNPLMREEDAVKRERIGPETIDGHPTIKEKLTVKGPDGNTGTAYYWLATDIGWPIQAKAVDGSWRSTFRDIKKGRQGPSLFEVPADYQKMVMPQSGGRDVYPEPPEMPGPPDMPAPPDAPDPGASNMPTPYF